jgi:hypothetical protein
MDEPLPDRALYPVGLAWFDYSIDYFELIPLDTLAAVRAGALTVLFYYHEGDNPAREKVRLDALCSQHGLSTDCYRFISGNTLAHELPGFVYFADHELFYWRNSVVWNHVAQPGSSPHTRARPYQFTLLSRLHKWWRATVITYLQDQQLLDRSLWSYNTVTMGDQPADNPIELGRFDGLRDRVDQFVAGAPYRCDSLTATQHNSHWIHVPEHYEDSYCNIVLETMYDAEQSGCAFLSEKTFKPIRHGQPFVIFGAPGTLAVLRDLGYRTFDSAIPNCYDLVQNNTERFVRTVQAVKHIVAQDPQVWSEQCLADAQHNQQVFLASKYNRLNTLYERLHND